ncbi:FAD/NAD(P)-binding protein [Nitrospirillum iridis]|uniref:Putative NAD(P)/FAD-binding protein YdhS n=1 Tax=Nitrospirillum iridis TaxID=765888 RepID=A0A7X0AWX6_9PROT|nr:FAD/NAD(P)-binding protein [Nitrospirillum iridis]MBB6250826.1 putative NAD(P)/FAD-binding protein YdhS [Nitrospirillum iridis]
MSLGDALHTRAAPRVVILGGGFSGAIAALHLARGATVPVDIDIVEPRPLLGGGVAYSTPDPQHRINVPAARMSAFSADMGHFDRWLRRSGVLAMDPQALVKGGHIFSSRLEFGRYLDGLLREQAAADGPAHIRHVQRRATSITPIPRDAPPGQSFGYAVALDNGARLVADRVIIATSHPPPSPPPALLHALGDDPRLIANPWAPGALDALAPEARVLVMGSGLTMADILATLSAAGHKGPITVFSRRGLTPRGHALDATELVGDFASRPATTALALLRRVRATVASAEAEGKVWQAVLDAVRRDARAVWQALPLAQQRTLLRHLRPFWDAHRYRIAPQPEATIHELEARGQLAILAASLADIRADANGVHATLRPRRGGPALTRTVDAVVVATGPAHDHLIDAVPALAPLVTAGRLRPDALGLGIAVDGQSRVIDVRGMPDETLWVAGPLARATFGELMGLPQVLIHAEEVARSVALRLPGQTTPEPAKKGVRHRVSA